MDAPWNGSFYFLRSHKNLVMMDTVWMMPVKVNQLSVSLRRFEMSCHIWSRTLESNQTTQIFSHAMTGTSPDQTHIIYVHKIFSQHNDPMTNTQTLCNHLEMKGVAVTQQLLCGLESQHISQNTHLSLTRARLEIILTLHFSTHLLALMSRTVTQRKAHTIPARVLSQQQSFKH